MTMIKSVYKYYKITFINILFLLSIEYVKNELIL